MAGVVVVILVCAATSAFAASQANANGFGFQNSQIATSGAYSYSRDPAGGLIERVNTTSGMLDGCNTLAVTTSYQGYSLKVYISSYSPSTTSSLCVTAVFHDDSAVPLTWADGIDLDVNITVVSSLGDRMMSVSCVPSIPAWTNDSSPNPPQGIKCGSLWDTQAPVNGVAPAIGTYHVIASGSLTIPPGGQSASVNTNVNSRFDVNLVGS